MLPDLLDYSELNNSKVATSFSLKNSAMAMVTVTNNSLPVMAHGIRIRFFKDRSFSLQFARKLYSELRQLYSFLNSDSIHPSIQAWSSLVHL